MLPAPAVQNLLYVLVETLHLLLRYCINLYNHSPEMDFRYHFFRLSDLHVREMRPRKPI